jgi:hypothetical protein
MRQTFVGDVKNRQQGLLSLLLVALVPAQGLFRIDHFQGPIRILELLDPDVTRLSFLPVAEASVLLTQPRPKPDVKLWKASFGTTMRAAQALPVACW